MPLKGKKQVRGNSFLLAGAGSTHFLPAFLGNQLTPESEGEGVGASTWGILSGEQIRVLNGKGMEGGITLVPIFCKSA